jgi:hypothetical protein
MKGQPMVFMNAGKLDQRNIGSHITLPYLPKTDPGVTVAGAIALIIQDGDKTEIVLAGDDEALVVPSALEVEVSLPPAAAYTLHMKNAMEELIGQLTKGKVG